MDQPTASTEQSNPALRPLTLPAPPAWSQLTSNKQRLAALKADLESSNKLATKLESFTDEPTWNAYIPFGPLAYFSGQLIHTNDITHTLPVSPIDSASNSTPSLPPAVPSTAEEAAQVAEAGADWRQGDAWKVLKSAKQARTSALKSTEELTARIADLSATIEKQEQEVKKEQAAQAVGGAEGSEHWSFNERGEVINEEGLPMFDIREELPAEEVEEAKPEPVVEEKVEQPKQQMRYLIKKGGKQVVKPLNVPATPLAATPAPKPSAPSAPAPTRSPSAPSASPPIPNLDTKSILDALEEEEAAERELEKAREENLAREEELRQAAKPTASTSAPVSPPTAAAPPSATATAAPSPKPTKKPGKQFGGFSAGFLSKKAASTTKPTPSTASSPSTLSFPSPAACSTPASPPSSKITELPSSPSSEEPHHSPLHHTALPTKSIVRPTPPPSAPGTPRPDSPALGHRVKFDVPSGEAPGDKEVSPSQGKKRAIPLPPPPSAEEKAKEKEKDKFERPIKDKVVEREIQPPTAPGEKRPKSAAGDQTSRSKEERDRYLKTLGRPPKVRERVEGEEREREAAASSSRTTPTAIPPPSAPPGGATPTPIHTISLSAKKPSSSLSGEISITDIPSSDEEEDTTLHLPAGDDGEDSSLLAQPSLTSDGDSSSSDGFYASEDEDDEEFDIDAALHAREVALAYHDRRMGVGAGAGTGPLGGSQDPEAFDAWNQPEVPVDATLQGRPVSHGSSSRFRTGRLESAQMIIPSLLAQHVREDGQPSSDEDEDEDGKKDGLTQVERERLRKSLEALGRGEMPEPFEIGTTQERVSAPAPAVSRVQEKAPPQIIATPISVPSNAPTRKEEEEEVVAPAPAERPKKMSRFKARQLGLESDA